MVKNFWTWKKTNLQIQEAGRSPNRNNPKTYTPRHITIKLLKTNDKDKILKAAILTQYPT